MTELVTKCLVCTSENQTHFNTSQFKGRKVINVICKNCGNVFQSPRMTEEELDSFYIEQYRTLYQGTEGPNLGDLNTQKARASSLLNIISPHLKSVKTHLDIGSSAGELIVAIKNHYGNFGIGIEPGNSYRDHALSKGVDTFENLETIPEKYRHRIDLVSLGHVLEHLYNPIDYLILIREDLLSPAGKILIEVPNLYFHDSFEVAHLSAFSAHSLKQTLRLSGYKIEFIKKHGEPRSKLFPLYLTIIASPTNLSTSKIHSEKYVSQKRQLTMLIRKVISKILPKLAWLPKE